MFDSVQEIINSILICIKKEYTDKIAKVDFKIKSMESKLEKEES